MTEEKLQENNQKVIDLIARLRTMKTVKVDGKAMTPEQAGRYAVNKLRNAFNTITFFQIGDQIQGDQIQGDKVENNG